MNEMRVLKDWFEDDIRCLILQGPFSLCAYLGVSAEHPLSRFHYDEVPLDVHGGLTYSKLADDSTPLHPEGYYWFGWDYAHAGDRAPGLPLLSENDREWTLEEVEREVKDAVCDFKKIVRMVEKVF